jgi:ATP-binding cassette subfamily G (WHITE) protein 1
MPLIAVFTQQRQIIKRERASRTYRSSTAYLAKVISQIPLVVLSTAIFALPVYWMVGLYAQPREFFTFLAILFVHVTTATMLGIMVSSGVPNSRVGQIVGPMIIVVFLIFGGQIVNVNTTPVVFRWIRWISLIYLSYSALSQNQFNQITFDCGKAMACTPNGSNVLELFDLDDLWLWWCVLVNFSMAIVYFVIGYFLFDWRSRPLKKLK